MSKNLESGRELVEWTKAGPKYWRAHTDGAALVTELQVGGKKPRQTRKTFATKEAARAALETAERKKMVDGFVYVRDPTGASYGEPGQLLFAMRAPGGASCATFDVDPEARFAFLASGRGDRKAWVVWADLSNGRLERRDVPPDNPGGQLFIHAALVNADGSLGYYALNERLCEHNAATGVERVVAGFAGARDSHFNPFCVKPGTDAAHERLLVLRPKDVLEVREIRAGTKLCEASLRSPTAECRAASLSPSGSLIAAYMASRHVVYGHADAKGDKTNEVRVFRVKDGKLIASIKMPQQVTELSVTPDDTAVVVVFEHQHGPCAYAIDDGKRRYALSDGEGGPASCSAWAFSPDGAILAVADRRSGEVRLLDARTRKQRSALSTGAAYRGVGKLTFAAGGTRLFVGGGGLLEAYAVARA